MSESTSASSAVPPDERARRPRQVRVRDRLERREARVPELEDRDRSIDVLQAVLAEIGELDPSTSSPVAAESTTWPP